jgi:hypothetical protein
MNDKTNIAFVIDLSPDGIEAALDEITQIAEDVPLFGMASVESDDTHMNATLLARDRNTIVQISGQVLNLEMTDRIKEITGGGLGGHYNHRAQRYEGGVAPGGSFSLSSKTKLGKVMKYLGGDADVAKAFRTATAGNILRITDHSDEETAPGVTRVEVFKKDEYVEACWDVDVEGMALNVEIKATAKVAIDRNTMVYSISFDYSTAGPVSTFKEMLKGAGYRPFRGTIT